MVVPIRKQKNKLKNIMIKVQFPDGSIREYEQGVTVYQVAESISPRLAADCLAASVDDATVDMSHVLENDCAIKFFKWDDAEGKHAFGTHRRTCWQMLCSSSIRA